MQELLAAKSVEKIYIHAEKQSFLRVLRFIGAVHYIYITT